MIESNFLSDEKNFSKDLYEKLILINPGINELAFYEFEYALNGVKPIEGWNAYWKSHSENLDSVLFDRKFFESIQLKPTINNKIILDQTILWLTRKLLICLVNDEVTVEWVNKNFYFDIRAFCFFVRTQYFNERIFSHFGGDPHFTFEPKQKELDSFQEIGYHAFKLANQEIDQAFISTIFKLIQIHGVPILITLAGPTGAGKTEITKRIKQFLFEKGMHISTIEMDNFYKDREFRDGKASGKEVIHFELFLREMKDLLKGKTVEIPSYDFYQAISSHDFESKLRPGKSTIQIEPADVIFLEGNFPFYIQDLDELISLRTVYLTDDPIRLKRKWRRDIDLRKKYDPVGFVNRYFRTQFIRAQEIYLPLMEVCDLVVDTTNAAMWLKPDWIDKLQAKLAQEMQM